MKFQILRIASFAICIFTMSSHPLPFALGEEVDDVMKVHATSFLQLLKREISSFTATSVLSNKPLTITLMISIHTILHTMNLLLNKEKTY